MAITSNCQILVTLTGDVNSIQSYATLLNAVAAGPAPPITLTLGANTITVPTGGTTPTGVLIIPPAGNSNTITFKGVTGDTGVVMHPTNPCFFPIGPAVTSFVLNASALTTGMSLVWL